jgi:kynureninase
VRRLRARGVWADARGEVLRLGPAPYLSDAQLEDAIALLGEAARERFD